MISEAVPIEARAFAEFGRVLVPDPELARAVNEGRGYRIDLAAFAGQDGATVLARYDMTASGPPVEVRLLERHPRSDQAFYPLGDAIGLVVVAPAQADGRPDLSGLRAFIAGPATPFLYRAGTWHAPLFSIARAGSFLMIATEAGNAGDCETFALDKPATVILRSGEHGITASRDESRDLRA